MAVRVTQAIGEVLINLFDQDIHITQVVGEVLVGPEPLAWDKELDIRLYDKTGRRKKMPQDWVTSLTFDLIERGGMGSGQLDLQCEWGDLELDGNEFVDVRLFGTPIYRGWVRIPNRFLNPTERASFSLQSLVETLNHYPVLWPYAYGEPVDLADVARDLIGDFVATGERLGFSVPESIQSIGVTLKQFDATGRSVAQAFNMLCDYAPNKAIWGVEIGDWTAFDPRNIIYFLPKPTDTGKYYGIGGLVSGFAYPKDSGQVVNVLSLTGGAVEQPNLCYNPSFEEVAPASETVGNLLVDYSFEEGSSAWTAAGGASRKFTGQDGTARGTPKSGKYWVELDTNGEAYSQIVGGWYNHSYVGSCWARRETLATPRSFKMTMEGLDISDTVLVSADTGWQDPGATGVWTKYTVDLDTRLYSTVVKLRFRVETNGGTASQDGVLIDDCAVVVRGSAGAVGWTMKGVGNALPEEFDWAYRLPAEQRFHKGYVVRCKPEWISTTNDYIEIRTQASKRIEVPPNERLSLICHTTELGGPFSQFSFGITEYNSDGTATTTTESDIISSTPFADWTQSIILTPAGSADGEGMTTRSDTASVEVFFRFRRNARNYLDGFFLCLGQIPNDVRYNGDYWAGDNYERRFKVEDALFTGSYALDADAVDSIDNYGEREQEESNLLVTDLTGAKLFAKDFFNQYAVPIVTASLEVRQLDSASQLLQTQDDRVQILNLQQESIPSLNAARVGYTVTPDEISFNADLGSELPRLESLIRYAQDREKGRQF